MVQNADPKLRRAEYLAKAEEALRLSTESADQKVGESFATIARTWRDLAAQLVRKSEGEPPLDAV